MEEEKRKRLAAIANEVKDLHPLLRVLLPKIPHVQQVEYTHGPSEMGADFVFSRFDDTLRQLDYVGVVAKVGKIEQPTIPDIERQIDECFDPKLFGSGKDRIHVNEVWVVTNAGVSSGARQRIHEKFRGRKVNFVSGDRLAALIDDHVPNYWTSIPLRIGDYLNQLRVRNDEIDRSISLARNHADVYVEQDVYSVPEAEWESQKSKRKQSLKVDVFQRIARDKVVLIEGEMGSGKSKLLRYLVRHFTHPQHFIDSGIVPIFLTYKTLIDKYGGDLDQAVVDYVRDEALQELGPTSTFLFLIDGVDEKNLRMDEQIEGLSKLVQRVGAAPNIKAVITSRHLGSLGEKKDSLRNCSRLEIRPLSISRVIEFIQKLCSSANISKRIFEDLKKSHLFKELPRSPIAAILLANLLQEHTPEIPSNMTELFAKYLELVLGRWDIEKGLQTQKEYEVLDSVLMNISEFFINNEIHYLGIDEIQKMIDSYVRPRNTGVSSARAYQILIERAGIVMVDESESRICFKHRAFAEYFYAKKQLKQPGFVVDERAFRVYWQNVFFFYVGQLKDCPSLLQALSAMKVQSENERLIKMINMGNYFMAGSNSTYDVIETGLAEVVRDAALLYIDILDQRIASPLANFSEMHLLWLFQAVLRDSYAFEFFRNALGTAALQVDDMCIDSRTKAIALYFLSVIYVDIDGKESFDMLLKKHSKDLPLSVQLAICHEGKDAKHKSALLKHQEKAVRKAVRNNRSLQDRLSVMYDRPIRTVKNKIT